MKESERTASVLALAGPESLKEYLLRQSRSSAREVDTFNELFPDQIFDLVGGHGKYQFSILFLLLIASIGVFTFIVMIPTLLTPPELLCRPKNSNSTYESCSFTKSCLDENEYIIDNSTILKTWIFIFTPVCNVETTELKYFICISIGFILSSIFISPLSDIYGRKAFLFLSSFLCSILLLKTLFTTSNISLYVTLFLQSLFVSVFFTCSFTQIIEFSSRYSRPIYCAFLLAGIPLSGLFNSFLIYFLKSYLEVFVISAYLILFLFSGILYLKESPYYSISFLDFKTAKDTSLLISNENKGRNFLFSFNHEADQYKMDYLEFDNNRRKESIPILEIFVYQSFCLKSLFILIMSICLGYLLGDIGIFSDTLTNNNIDIISFYYLIDTIAVISAGILIYFLGRKKSILFSCLIGMIIKCVNIFLDSSNQYINSTLIFLSRIIYLLGFISAIIFFVERFPCRVRSSGCGLVLSGVFIGFTIINCIPSMNKIILLIIYSIIAIIIITVLHFLEETSNSELAEDFVEVIQYRNKCLIDTKQDELNS